MRDVLHKRLLSILVLLILTTAIGCQTQNIDSFFAGQQVNSDDSRPLVAGQELSGQWQTFDILVNYRYLVDNGTLKISGDATLSDYYQMNMRSLRDMDMFLFLLDDQRKVLETVQLFKALDSELAETRNFTSAVAIPAGAAAISFGYRGFARDGGLTGLHRFDHLPEKGN